MKGETQVSPIFLLSRNKMRCHSATQRDVEYQNDVYSSNSVG